jgi:hypothetical protein
MGRMIIIMSLSMIFATPQSLQANDNVPKATQMPSIELWRGLTTATTKAELKAFRRALPKKGRAELYPGCDVEVGYRYIKERLVSIILLGTEREGNCTRQIMEDMTAKYGDPILSQEAQATGPIGTRYGSITHTDFIWKLPEKRIALYVIPGRITSYTYVFTLRPDKFLH